MNIEKKPLISIQKCRVQSDHTVLIPELNWKMNTGEAWLVIGSNRGQKGAFLQGLAGKTDIVPNAPDVPVCREHQGFSDSSEVPLYANIFASSVELVSLERAAALIEEERSNDESDYIEGGVDPGRTGRRFLSEVTRTTGDRLESDPQVKLCGVEKILDRGLKYMSTGEIRRTLLCRALLSGKKLLVLSNPFAGLDSESRTILLEFFNTIASKQLSCSEIEVPYPRILLAFDRYTEVPSAITHVLEFSGNTVSFCGLRPEYEQLLAGREAERTSIWNAERAAFTAEVSGLHCEMVAGEESPDSSQALIDMKDVTVGWNGNQVLKQLSWTLYPGEHWLIRGPNGSGKTTFLELITGDNMQVFCNNISLFGKRRGSGETVWDIRAKLGIVSYRLHVEYRMVGDTDLESVIISGFHDSIGLYEQKTDVEIVTARKWLKLGGFSGREQESFGSLSYGEQRAVLIIRAAVKCPRILILDEPCHGLDDEYRGKILALLETIAKEGSTTLLHVTHDPSEVLPCEKHILELHPDEDPMYQIILRKQRS